MAGRFGGHQEGAGRPTNCTPAITKLICEQIVKGVPVKFAAPLVGVPHKTCIGWVKRGRAGEEPFAAFYVALTEARSEAVSTLVKSAWEHAQSERGAWIVMRLLECYAREFFGQSSTEVRMANLRRGNQPGAAQSAAMSMDQIQAAMNEHARLSDDPDAVELRKQIIADYAAREGGTH